MIPKYPLDNGSSVTFQLSNLAVLIPQTLARLDCRPCSIVGNEGKNLSGEATKG